MKKTFALMLAAMMLAGALSSCGGDAEDTTVDDTAAKDTTADETTTSEKTVENSVYVTIVNGDIELAYDEVALADADNDGAMTVNDALYLAHQENYNGGAEAGFANEETEWGLSLMKLWGVENGGTYGYLVNNVSALSLTDPIETGDHIVAYVYTDLVTWSDTYTYFDITEVEASVGGEVTLTLMMNGYDAAWNAITLPVEGAVITLDGEATEYVTDAEGKVTLTLDKSALISATSETLTMVAPVCAATVQ